VRKVFDAESFTESQDAMREDEVHDLLLSDKLVLYPVLNQK